MLQARQTVCVSNVKYKQHFAVLLDMVAQISGMCFQMFVFIYYVGCVINRSFLFVSACFELDFGAEVEIYNYQASLIAQNTF